MKKLTPLYLIFTAIFFLLPLEFAVSQVSSDVVVIVNKSVQENSLSSNAIKNIFLGNKSVWDNGQKVQFLTLNSGDIHEIFLKKYVNKTASQFNSYWIKQVFTGKGKSPKSFDSENALVEYVSTKDGAIGYVSKETDTSSVKVITVN